MESVTDLNPGCAGGCAGEIVSLQDLVDAIGALERGRARIALAAARLAESGVWGIDGSLSMAAWLKHHTRMNATLIAAPKCSSMSSPVAPSSNCSELPEGAITGTHLGSPGVRSRKTGSAPVASIGELGRWKQGPMTSPLHRT